MQELMIAALIAISPFVPKDHPGLKPLSTQAFLEAKSEQEVATLLNRTCRAIFSHELAKEFEFADILKVTVAGVKADPPGVKKTPQMFNGIDLNEAQLIAATFCQEKIDAQLLERLNFSELYKRALAEYRRLEKSVDEADTKVASLKNYQMASASQVYDRDGNLIDEMYPAGEGRRLWVPIGNIPLRVRQAFLAAEDKRFIEHRGVDFQGLFRAIKKFMARDPGLQGGSTITQQVAKNMIVKDEKSLERKVRELIAARQMEQILAKDEVLELYLNYIYFGRGVAGIGMAARSYFKKSVNELSLPEAALLAGLVHGPGKYNPITDPAPAIERRNIVLERMREAGFIDATTEQQAAAAPLGVVEYKLGYEPLARYFTGNLEADIKKTQPNFAWKESHKIQTTIHGELQRTVNLALRQGLRDFEARIPKAQYTNSKGESAYISAAQVWRRQVPAEVTKDRNGRIIKRLDKHGKEIPESPPALIRALGDEIRKAEAEEAKITADAAKPSAPKRGFLSGRKDQTPTTEAAKPEAKKDPRPIWLRLLQKVGTPTQIPNWRAAIVLSQKAPYKIGFKDGTEGVLRSDKFVYQQLVNPNSNTTSLRQFALQYGDVVFVESYQDEKTKEVVHELVQPSEVEGAVVVMDVHNGHVLALSGGFDFGLAPLNRTQSIRQIGSTAKPFTYLAALQNRIQPNRVIPGWPLSLNPIRSGAQKFRPANSTKSPALGTLSYGLEQSNNLMTAHLMVELGGGDPERGLDQISQVMMDFDIYDKPLNEYTQILGARDTTIQTMAAAYAMLANGGKRIEPVFYTRTVSEKGGTQIRPVKAGTGEPLRSVDEISLYQLRSILQGVLKRGTASYLSKDKAEFVAGKTGTTDDNTDAWFIGFSADVVVAVWVGYDQQYKKLGAAGQGGVAALPIFNKVMDTVFAKYKPARNFSDLPVPAGIEFLQVDATIGSGKIVPFLPQTRQKIPAGAFSADGKFVRLDGATLKAIPDFAHLLPFRIGADYRENTRGYRSPSPVTGDTTDSSVDGPPLAPYPGLPSTPPTVDLPVRRNSPAYGDTY